MPDLLLAPLPRQVEARPGAFRFRAGQYILLPSDNAPAVLGAAERLQAALWSDAAADCAIVAADEAPSCLTSRNGGHDGASDAGPPEDIAVQFALDAAQVPQAEGYHLSVTPERLRLIAHDPAGAFYAAGTLSQLTRQFGAQIPSLEISDYPDFPARGVMLDVSLGKVPTMSTLYALVDWLASLKVNQLQLYVEHTFAYRRHPNVWASASPLTGQEILELDVFCRERFIDLVPNQNSFGHMTQWLIVDGYRHLAECPDGFDWPWGGHSDQPFSLSPVEPGSLELIRSLYDELLPHFTSRLCNVGCDETVDLGLGKSKAECARRGTHRLYLDFLLQIYRLVRQHGRTMQFWGDIIIQQPELIGELPQDAIALEWGYDADHPFDEHGAKFAASGIPFYVCPGTSSWISMLGRTDNALGNLRNAAEAGLKHGAIGYLNTDWGDYGHWQYLPVSYLGFLYGAAVSWCLDSNRNLDVAPALSLHAFGDRRGAAGRLAYDLGNTYQAAGLPIVHNSNFLVRLLLQPVEDMRWVSRVAPDAWDSARQAIRQALRHLDDVQMQRGDEAPSCPPFRGVRHDGASDAPLIREEFETAAHFLLHACDLGEFKQRLAQAQTPAARQALRPQAKALAQDMRHLITTHRRLWLARNRIGGLAERSVPGLQRLVDGYLALAA